jgi:pimeloyl-ACP methyl ester carboxylesterase
MSLPLLRRRGPAPGASVVREGVLYGGLPYLAVGQGPPLVVFSAFTAEHINPTGPARRFSLQPLRPLTRHCTVYLVNRKPGLQPGSTITDLAGHYAQALERAFTGPVAVMGISTGGSIAQQFAIDHPQLVRRLVLVATACRLGPTGRRMQRDLARFTPGRPATARLGGDRPRAGHHHHRRPTVCGAAVAVRAQAAPLGSLRHAGGNRRRGPLRRRAPAAPHHRPNPRDRRRPRPQLHPELFWETAEGIPGARLRLYRGKGHASISSRAFRDVIEHHRGSWLRRRWRCDAAVRRAR